MILCILTKLSFSLCSVSQAPLSLQGCSILAGAWVLWWIWMGMSYWILLWEHRALPSYWSTLCLITFLCFYASSKHCHHRHQFVTLNCVSNSRKSRFEWPVVTTLLISWSLSVLYRSRSIVQINVSLSFQPHSINVIQKNCHRAGRDSACLNATVCFLALSRSPGSYGTYFGKVSCNQKAFFHCCTTYTS